MVKLFIYTVFFSFRAYVLDSNNTIYDIMSSDGAKSFLDSVSRNSVRSKKTYAAGLLHFSNFLVTKEHTLKTIIEPLTTNKINVYELLDSFVGYLIKVTNPNTKRTLSKNSIALYMTAVRSYLQYYDIDIIPHKFKRKVRLPKSGREDEEAIDGEDIRKILLACNNRRLKTYLLVLASSGLRANEACSIRLCDINFDINPTRIHIRQEYTKTKVSRDIYISDEATDYLKQWIAWKYKNQRQQTPTDLIFTMKSEISFLALYNKLRLEFTKVLAIAGLDARKEGMQRRKVTLHSLRRYVKSVCADQVNTDYSDWYIGHAKSSYYTKKEPARRELYATKCMRHLTFLDYSILESISKNIDARLQDKEMRITTLEKEMKSQQEHWKESTEAMMKMINEEKSRVESRDQQLEQAYQKYLALSPGQKDQTIRDMEHDIGNKRAELVGRGLMSKTEYDDMIRLDRLVKGVGRELVKKTKRKKD